MQIVMNGNFNNGSLLIGGGHARLNNIKKEKFLCSLMKPGVLKRKSLCCIAAIENHEKGRGYFFSRL